MDESKKGIGAEGGNGGGKAAGVPFSKCFDVVSILILYFMLFHDM